LELKVEGNEDKTEKPKSIKRTPKSGKEKDIDEEKKKQKIDETDKK